MSTIKDTTVTIGGLSTLGNQLSGKPDGSLNDCDNVVLREPGVLEPAPYLLEGEVLRTGGGTTIANYVSLYATAESVTEFVSVWGAGTAVSPLYKYWLSVYDLAGGVAYNYENVTTSTTLATLRDFYLTPGDAQTSWARNRRMYTTDRGCLTWTRNTADSNYELRLAGMPAPKGIVTNGSTAGTPAIFPTPGCCAYRATLVRKYPNYTLESAVTPATIVRTTIDITAVSLVVTLDSALDARPGDIVVVYRTAAIEDPDGATNPGDDMQEATRVVLTSTETAAGAIVIADKNRNTSLGAALYTSTEGLPKNNFAPPNAHDVCTFNDTTFYALTQDYPTVSFSMPNFGPKASGASVGFQVFNVTTAVLNATTGTVPGDQRLTILPNMVVISNNYPAVVDTVTYNGAVTTVTLKTGGYAGYINHYNKVAGAANCTFFDTWLFSFTEYDGSTTTSLTILNPTNAAAAYSIPAEVGVLSLGLSGVAPGLRRIGVTTWRISINPDGVTWAVVATVRMTQPAAFRSFSVNVTHGTGYMSMDTYTYFAPVVVADLGVDRALKLSTQSTDKATLYFSKSQLPESVPAGNYFPVGHGDILRLFSDQNSMYAACTDGLYRITGQGNDWTVVQLSKTFRLVSKHGVTQCLGTPFVWGLDGISTINESGPRNISTPYIGPALSFAAAQFTPNVIHPAIEWPPCMIGDDTRQEVTLQLQTTSVDFAGAGSFDDHFYGQPYVLNLVSLAFYKRTQIEANAMVYQPKWRMSLYFRSAGGDALVAWEERPGEIFMNSGFLPVYNNVTLRRYPHPRSIFWIFNPFKAQASVLKQWIDCNVLIRRDTGDDAIVFQAGPDAFGNWNDYSGNSMFRFVFSNDELSFFTLPQAKNWQYCTVTSLSRQHSDVPRRVSVNDTLTVGCQVVPEFFTEPVDLVGLPDAINYPRFKCEGFTLRYRVASDTFQI